MKVSKFKLLVVIIIGVALLTSGFGCKKGNLAAVNDLKEPVTLKYWRVFDSSDSFSEIIASYKALHPNVKIEYRKLRYEEYEKELLQAWAEDRGPDIFTIHNTWIGKYKSKVLELPEVIKLPYVVEIDKRTKEISKADYRQIKTITPAQLRSNFAETVYQDVVRGGKIMGLPLSVDTLALFYNRVLFDRVQITQIPRTWLEVKEAVKKLTLQDDEGNLVQAGIALGTSGNINRATDVVSLLMMQNGTNMVDASTNRATFDQSSPYSSDKSYKPGIEAVRFYTDFAMPSKEVYSWNDEMPDAVSAFVAGRLAMMVGYSYQLPLIKTQGAKLNIGIGEVPHINSDGSDAMGNKVNFASYWVETVAQKTKYPDYAWDFVQFASRSEHVQSYLKKTKKPSALRNLITTQLIDPEIAPFANQVLTANSWYRGKDALLTESVFGEMIDLVLAGKSTASQAVSYAVRKINQTF